MLYVSIVKSLSGTPVVYNLQPMLHNKFDNKFMLKPRGIAKWFKHALKCKIQINHDKAIV